MLKAGIVGLPNVGKSTLFNALTRSRKAEAANYPFCTIDPNVGVVTVPDERAYVLQKIAKTNVVIPAAIEFVDIAGLVAGASKGEGLGNQFLANIREVDAIVQVVRCFEDSDVVHTMGGVDPVRDIEVITTELVLADLDAVAKRLPKTQKAAKAGDKEAVIELALLNKLEPHLNAGKTANTLDATDDEKALMKLFQLLTAKPVLFACNVAESDLATAEQNKFVQKVAEYVRTHHDAAYVPISAKIESELIDLPPEEAKAFLKDLGVDDSGVSALIRGAYGLLGLQTYFTAGEKEVRAWTIKKGWKAPQAAGVIHTDFEKGFIKAEIVSYDDLTRLSAGSAVVVGAKLALLAFWTLLTLLLFAISPREVLATSESVALEPFRNFTLGLTGVFALVLTALFFSAFSGVLLGLPLLALVAVVALGLRFWGMVAVFHALGAWLWKLARRRPPAPLTAATCGLLTLGVLKFLPYVGIWTWTAATFLGVGAALATKLGRREPWFQAV